MHISLQNKAPIRAGQPSEARLGDRHGQHMRPSNTVKAQEGIFTYFCKGCLPHVCYGSGQIYILLHLKKKHASFEV